MDPIRIFLIEKQPHKLQNHIRWFKQKEDISILGSAQSGETALLQIDKFRKKPNIVLLDISLPGISGTQVTRSLKILNSDLEVIIFAHDNSEKRLLEAIHAGASGYLLTPVTTEKIYESILEVSQGGSVIEPKLTKNLFKYLSHPPRFPEFTFPQKTALTLRELECLQMVAKGLSNGETAQVLSLSRATIRTHLEHIYQKLDVTNRVEAVTEGIRQGIIEI